MNIKKSLKEKIVINSIVGNLLLPQTASVAVSCLGVIINGILAGNYYSSDALAAVGFSAPLMLVINLLRVTISGGANILCGKALGNGNNQLTKEIFRTTVLLYFISGGIFTLILFIFAGNIAFMAGAKDNVFLITTQYLRGLSFGFIPMLLVTGIISFLPYANDSIYAFISSLVLAVSSLVLGVISQKFFNSGVIGLALASSLSQLITLLFLFARCLLSKEIKKYVSFSFQKPNIKLAIQIIYHGASSGFLSICNVITPIIVVSRIPKVGGMLAVAAYGIHSSISGLVYSIDRGISQVSTMIVSVHLGVKDISSARNALNYLLAVGSLLVGIECILISIFAPQIAISFGATNELIPIAVKAIRILSIYTFVILPENILITVYQCQEKFKELYVLYLFVNLILPISYVFAFEKILGMDAIWTCWLFADLCSFIYYIFMSIKIRKKIPNSYDQICIPESFTNIKRITASIQTKEQVSIFSDNVIKFCKENNIADDKAYYCGLCVEELISNTIEYGFSESKKKFLGVDAYVSISDDKIFIRIMDNAKLFDPLKKLGMGQSNIGENLGLNIVNNITGDFSYRPIYGNNAVYLTFCINSNKDLNEIKNGMLTPQYWTKDDSVIMNGNSINNFNDLILNDKASRRFSLKYGELPTYDDKKDFVLYNLNKYQNDFSSTNIENISNEIINGLNHFGKEYKFGICIKRDAIMSLPITGTFEECKPYTLSPLHINEGVVIYSSTENGKWFFIRSAIYYGWVHSENIALCQNRNEMIDYLNFTNFLIVTNDSLTLSLDENNQIKYDMGDRINLISETPEHYIVTVFNKNSNQYITKKEALISKTADVYKGYCSFTKINLLDKCFKLFGAPYRWGGGEGARDCSSTIMEIFSCFGFQFPRNSNWQSQMPLKNIVLSNFDRQQKIKILDSLETGSLLFTDNHVMLYLGCIDNNHYVFHNTGVFCQNNNPSPIHQYSVTINSLEKTYTTDGVCWIDALTNVVSFQ